MRFDDIKQPLSVERSDLTWETHDTYLERHLAALDDRPSRLLPSLGRPVIESRAEASAPPRVDRAVAHSPTGSPASENTAGEPTHFKEQP
jgi:hypothetical protein